MGSVPFKEKRNLIKVIYTLLSVCLSVKSLYLRNAFISIFTLKKYMAVYSAKKRVYC